MYQAYAITNKVGRVQKEKQRKLDRLHKKEFLPVVNRTPVEPPPIIVAVQGPPGVKIYLI